jgi:hypothetical protein
MTAQDLKLDYFLIYDLENKATTASVQLQGQFDRQRITMRVALLDFFGNAVSKNREPIYDKRAHLAWYRGVHPAEPMRRVVAENQFGKFDLRTGTPDGLLVPTHKIESGSAFPEGLDHFKVYRLVDPKPVPDTSLKLVDQFGRWSAKLRQSLFFAVPVTKRVGTTTYPIKNERAHLMIFGVTANPGDKTIKIRNQFTGAQVQALRSLMLAVPTVKRDWKPL